VDFASVSGCERGYSQLRLGLESIRDLPLGRVGESVDQCGLVQLDGEEAVLGRTSSLLISDGLLLGREDDAKRQEERSARLDWEGIDIAEVKLLISAREGKAKGMVGGGA
jgi:hypothetical protein